MCSAHFRRASARRPQWSLRHDAEPARRGEEHAAVLPRDPADAAHALSIVSNSSGSVSGGTSVTRFSLLK